MMDRTFDSELPGYLQHISRSVHRKSAMCTRYLYTGAAYLDSSSQAIPSIKSFNCFLLKVASGNHDQKPCSNPG